MAGHEEADAAPVGLVVPEVVDYVHDPALVDLRGVICDGDVCGEKANDDFLPGGRGNAGGVVKCACGEYDEDGEEGVDESHFFVFNYGIDEDCEDCGYGKLHAGCEGRGERLHRLW